VRTLIISDLHIGSRRTHDVLTRPEPLRRLLDALDGVERLVLLGDVVELMGGRPEQAMSVAEPILRRIGERLGSEREVLVVPGNHDRPLVRAWLRLDPARLSLDTDVPPDATSLLSRLTQFLAPARVCVRYPGAWLREGVYATHGHYLDLHLMPRSAVGVARSPLSRPARNEAVPDDYERARRPSAARFSRWLPLPLAALLEDAAELARASTMPRVRRHLLRPGVAPLTSRLLGFQMQRASIPALDRVIHRLGVDARWIIFGHVHRAGPLHDDHPADWVGADGSPRFVNCGSWLYEPRLVHRAVRPHPYWPGGAVMLADGEEPSVLGILDDLDEADLRS
jgi:Calcineurin-like phosphoesterase